MLLDRYLMREIGASFLAVAIILVVIFLAYSLTRYLTDAAGGLLNAGEVARLTLYKSVIALEVLLPLAFYFGVIVACGRMSLHGELAAMRACGLRTWRLNRPLVLLGVLLAAAVGALSLEIRPWAYGEVYALKDRAESSSELDRIKPRRFYLYEGDDRAVYVESIGDRGRALSGIFIRTRRPDGLEVITAPRGELTPYATSGSHRLVLDDASVYRSSDVPPDVYGRFGALTLSLAAHRGVDHEYRAKSAASTTLADSTDPLDRAELQWRLSTPASTLLLAFTALALVDHRPRSSRFARLPLAVGIYALYYNLLGVARTGVEHHTLATLWWAPATFAAALAAALAARRWRRRR